MKFKNVLIHEKFSDSMPAWLKNYFIQNQSPGSKYADPEYKGFAGAKARDVGRDTEIGTAIKVLHNKGLDENRVTIISQPLPSNINDPIFSDSDKMCLVHLKSNNDETLWIPNHSAPQERFMLDDGKITSLKYLNNKQYKQYAKDFAYIDLTDPNNFTSALKKSRFDARKGSEERDLRQGKLAENPFNWEARSYDKSGYKKIPAARKYADKLAKYKLVKLPKKLLEVRDKLADAFKLVNNFKNDYLFGFDLTNLSQSGTQEQRQIQQAMMDADAYLQGAFASFKDALQAIRRLPDPDSGYVPDRWSLNYVQNKIEDTDNKIFQAINQINSFLPKSIDWNADDETIYTDDDWTDFM